MSDVIYIKLGAGGEWAVRCLTSNMIEVGFNEVDHSLCVRGSWDEVKHLYSSTFSPSTSTMYANQLRRFYEASPTTTFITFHGGALYHCNPGGPVHQDDTGNKKRATTADGWSKFDANGRELRVDRISGRLTTAQGFRSTICTVNYPEAILRLIAGIEDPSVATAKAAQGAYAEALLALVRLLTPKDFELLVSLLFSTSGWRQIGETGGVQKTVDFSLELPSTGDRAFVQVKSSATVDVLREYVESHHLIEDPECRMFFVWHSGSLREDYPTDGQTILIGPTLLSRMVVNAGLGQWLIDRS